MFGQSAFFNQIPPGNVFSLLVEISFGVDENVTASDALTEALHNGHADVTCRSQMTSSRNSTFRASRSLISFVAGCIDIDDPLLILRDPKPFLVDRSLLGVLGVLGADIPSERLVDDRNSPKDFVLVLQLLSIGARDLPGSNCNKIGTISVKLGL